MSFIADFIQSGHLPDIEYRTVAPEEIVSPRITTREGVPVVYMHGERSAPHKGFVPVADFLHRLARREPNLAVTGYRANGRQTTISFNKTERVTLSPRLQAFLLSLASARDSKSGSVVAFLANLSPLYAHERHDGLWCARSLSDGTLILPVDETEWGEEIGRVMVHWQGDSARQSEINGEDLAALALERYVRLHGVGASEEAIAAELWFMDRHFTFKTGCHANLPLLPEPPSRLAKAGRKALEMGQGILTNLITPRL
ncbi:hypothetical protein [Thermomonas mangrovi]|uniref:hypothetical protein n=1 Tax=Thermomonas mangrovi TaxID=2993316 RepID=UPI002307321B|nr:hypothetical protein [Thermomonas mangrovi]